MRKAGLVLIILVMLSVISAGCLKKGGILLNFSNNTSNSTNTTSTNSSAIIPANNTTLSQNITEPHDPGVPEEPNQSTN